MSRVVHVFSATTLFLLLTASCYAPPSPTPFSPPTVDLEVEAATLPPSWTSTSLPEPSFSPPVKDSPTPTIAPVDTEFAGPEATATTGIGPALPPASPTPPNTEPERIVSEAWQAFLDRDEAKLTSYYNSDGKQICTLGFGSTIGCVGIAYRAQGLRTLEHWYTLEPSYVLETGAVVFLVTKWAESEAHWQHMFLLIKEDGVWKLDEPQTIVYEWYPE